MATAHQILSLLKSHVEGDDEQLYAVALQIAAAEARRGRHNKAEELRSLVETGRNQNASKSAPRLIRSSVRSAAHNAHKGLESLARITEPKTRLSDMVLSPEVKARLDQLLLEQRQRARLREYSQHPDTRVLLIGLPGCGKTMSANAIAGELSLPLVTIRLDTLITRFLGETATHLRRIFDEIASQRAVYLFDEFDALGNSRGDHNDIGEMRRVLNSFLQFLEEPNSTDSPVIATTNRPEILDTALLRRFDAVIRYKLPNTEDAYLLLQHHLGMFSPKKFNSVTSLKPVETLSPAEIALAARDAIKDAILNDRDVVDIDTLRDALEARVSMQNEISTR